MEMNSPDMVRRRVRRIWVGVGLFLILFVAAAIAAYELIASPFQAMFLAGYGKRLTYQTEAGPSDSLRFPEAGPARRGQPRARPRGVRPRFLLRVGGPGRRRDAARGAGLHRPAPAGRRPVRRPQRVRRLLP